MPKRLSAIDLMALEEVFEDIASNIAKDVILQSRRSAVAGNYEYVWPEHFIIGLLGRQNGTAVFLLKKMGVDVAAIVGAANRILKRQPDIVLMGKIPNMPEVSRGLKVAVEESEAQRCTHINTAHILLGLFRECHPVRLILINFGFREDSFRKLLADEMAKPTCDPKLIG